MNIPHSSQANGYCHYSTVAIAGLGLLGGALAMALRQAAPEVRVLGVARRRESLDQALAAGAIDQGTINPRELLEQAELTVVCMPVNATIEFCHEYADSWRPGAMVIDVGSTKDRIVEQIRPVLAARGINFTGCHPMAGSEQSGFAAASPGLYRNATVFLTPVPGDIPANLDYLVSFWRFLGARVRIVEPGLHDAMVARTSHLPHLLAPALISLAMDRNEYFAATSGGAFRDMTRIAASSPAMWRDILEQNREQVLAALSEFQDELRKFTTAIKDYRWSELQEFFEQARQMRLDWARRTQSEEEKE